MKKICLFFAVTFLFFSLSAEELVIFRPQIVLNGKRIIRRPLPAKKGEITRFRTVTEYRFRVTFALRNNSVNVVKTATGFTQWGVREDTKTGIRILFFSHARLKGKFNAPSSGKEGTQEFDLVFPAEEFRVVTLKPGEGTLITKEVFVDSARLQSGDQIAVEYAPCSFGRYDFWQGKILSRPVTFQLGKEQNAPLPSAVL